MTPSIDTTEEGDALALLSACHARIVRQCATLRRLVLYLGECGCDSQAQLVAATVVRFFDTELARLHADEERLLFPALIESMAGSDAVCIHDLGHGLALEHRALEDKWRALRPCLLDISVGQGSALAAADVESFAEPYLRHIAREESELLPMAARLLADDELERIARGMRERRSA